MIILPVGPKCPKIMIFNQLDLKRMLENQKSEGEAHFRMVTLRLVRGISRIPMIFFLEIGHLLAAYKLFADNPWRSQSLVPNSKFAILARRNARSGWIITLSTPSGGKKNHLSHFARSCRSYVRSIQLFSASYAHEKSRSDLRLVPLQPLNAQLQAQLMYHNRQLVHRMRKILCISLSVCSQHPILSKFCVFLWRIVPGRGGRHYFSWCKFVVRGMCFLAP